MSECLFCGETLQTEVETKDDKMPICKKKQCIKFFARAFGRICQAIDKKCGMDPEGFLFNDKLIRYGFFDEDFEKYFKELRKEEQ